MAAGWAGLSAVVMFSFADTNAGVGGWVGQDVVQIGQSYPMGHCRRLAAYKIARKRGNTVSG